MAFVGCVVHLLVNSGPGFASLMVILPSAATGGAIEFSLGGMSLAPEDELSNLFHVTALSWYSEVAVSTGPVTQGYRLALTYKISHVGLSPCPCPYTRTDTIQKLRHSLQFWAQDRESRTPEKLLYLLEGSYSPTTLSIDTLNGSDGHKALVFKTLAQELGLHVGLANVNCHLCGYADEKFRKLEEEHETRSMARYARKEARWRRDRLLSSPPTDGSISSQDSEEEQNVEFGEVHIRESSVDRFVDTSGQWIADALAFEEHETIPEDLCEDAEGEDHYKQEYGGFRNVRLTHRAMAGSHLT